MLDRIYQLNNELDGSIFLFGDIFSRTIDDIECLYVLDFFRKMWQEGI